METTSAPEHLCQGLFPKSALSSLRQFLAAKSPLKMIKKALFFRHVAKRLDKKDNVNFKFDDATPCLTNNCVIHILPNISRSKANQTMKFGQLIECNMRNIFLETSYTKCCGETSPRPFYIETKLQTICFYLILSNFKK